MLGECGDTVTGISCIWIGATIETQQKAGRPASSLRPYNPAVLHWFATGPGNLRAQVTGWDSTAWEAARWSIQVHGTAPLLHQASRHWPDADALDPIVSGYLAAQEQRSRARVSLLLSELAEILEACQAASLPVMPLKGSLLNARYYPAPGLRPMNDLDLLVRPADESRIHQILAKLGYRLIGQSRKHVTFARPEATGPIVAWDGEHPANPRSIDLHVRLREQYWSTLR